VVRGDRDETRRSRTIKRGRDAGAKLAQRDFLTTGREWRGNGGESGGGGAVERVTLTRSSNHPCETQSALLCLGNSVEFVVKVVNVNLGIQTVLSPPRARSVSPLSYVQPLSALLAVACTRATPLRKCRAMFADSLAVRNTRFVLPLILRCMY